MAEPRFTITKLNNSNFQVWKCKVELLLVKEDLWHTIEDETPSQPSEIWSKADRKARATIGLLVEDDQLRHIRDTQSAKDSWAALRNYHQKASLTNQVFLFKRICSMKLTEVGDMENHINKMLNIIDQLTALGETLKDKMIIALLLCSLPESYDTLITALETRSEDELTVELVKGKLLDEDRRRKNARHHMDERDDKALRTQYKYGIKVTPERQDNKGIICFFCKKSGHVKKDCTKYKKWKAAREKANQAIDKDSTSAHICFSIRSTGSIGQDWCIDSGATSHMTSNKRFFDVLNACSNERVKLANGDCAEVRGIGSGCITCKDNKGNKNTVLVENVLYVPTLEESLLSVKKLAEKGLEVKFTGNMCTIIKKGITVAAADSTGSLYKLRVEHKALMTTNSHSKNCQHTWHRRLGHRDPEAVKEMITKDLATDLKVTDCGIRTVCKTCVKGKMARKSYPKKTNSKTEEILDLIHTDVCGPMQTATPGKKRYILTLIDDYSRFTFIYLIEHKSEVSEKIQDYVRLMKTKFGKVPKIIRSDRGKEYVNAKLIDFLCTEGIERQYTVGYAPEQNGVAERKNRHLLEMARCMLIDADLPNKYWGEAVSTANYLQNRLYTRATGTTPFQRWYKKKPTLQNIYIFGSKVCAHVPKELRRKLDNKAKDFLFVGYAEDAKGYRLLDTDTDKVIISRDVNFLDENNNTGEVLIEEEQEIISNTEEEKLTNEEETHELQKEEIENTTEQEENNTKDNQTLRRSKRTNRGVPPDRFCNIAYHAEGTEGSEPSTYQEAISSPNCAQWIKGMKDEFDSLTKASTWTLVDRPADTKIIGSKWVYKAKSDAQGNVVRYKARLVAQGYSQEYGVDYQEVFAPVARQTTFRTLLAVASKQKLIVKHYDVKNAFLNGNLEENIYMTQPKGFEVKGKENMVCKLNKNIYGLKQAARVWNKKLEDILTKDGYKQSQVDLCLYTKDVNNDKTYVILYVDDIIVASSKLKYIHNMYKLLNNHFELTGLGDINYYLGIKIEKDNNGIYSINQTGYIEKLLKMYKMEDAKESRIPLDIGYGKTKDVSTAIDKKQFQSLIGALIYLATNTRMDIAASVSILSRKMNCPTQADWIEAKRVIRYLKGTKNLKLILGNSEDQKGTLVGYADADWAQDVKDRKSNSGYLFKFNEGTISWACRKQSCVALSSTEAEYVALAEACQEAVWLRGLLRDLGEEQVGSTIVFEDNQSCIKLVYKDSYSKRTKHVSTKYHYVKDLSKTNIVSYEYCPTEMMTADMLTKPLQQARLKTLRERGGLKA